MSTTSQGNGGEGSVVERGDTPAPAGGNGRPGGAEEGADGAEEAASPAVPTEAGAGEGNGAAVDRGRAAAPAAPPPAVSAEDERPAPAVAADGVPDAADVDGGSADGEAGRRATARRQAEMRAAEARARKEAKRRERASRPKVKKLRAALVFTGLGLLAVVSWVFGVMMAVAGDLPELETRAQYDRAQNSVVTDRFGNEVATLTGNERRILVESEDISPLIKQAVVAIEDERFYEHRGIDYLGIARALREDIMSGSAAQGGSTITQQFVKNALAAQASRTVLQKLREAALAYQVERQWSKDKILTNYLNNIYFGEGAYGIEGAARTFFGSNHPGCGEADGEPCASVLRVEEAAMLAGMIQSPSTYSPIANPQDAVERRNVVLGKMRELGTLDVTDEEFEELTSISGPAATTIEPPSEQSEAPYFTDWLRQQVVDRYGAGEAFGGGLRVESTLDLEFQQAAQEAVDSRIEGLGPTAAVVAIENGTGKVRAMVGGGDFDESPFNVATNGLRQPGSSFKPFTLLAALANGKSPDEVYESAPQEIPFVNEVKKKNGKVKKVNELFEVENYEDSYLGSATIADATTYSDNSVYAQLGLEVGVDTVAKTAKEMGVESRLSRNPAMILGGLKRGVTPLEMAFAFSTLANGGNKISGTMGSRGNGSGPVAIEKVKADGDTIPDDLGSSGENEEVSERVIDSGVAETSVEILRTVVTEGTGENAQVGDDFVWGKTGTTDDNADAWFVGANEEITVAVWVGHPDGATPMLTEYGGGPVDGGTIPALIWQDVVAAYDELAAARKDDDDEGDEEVDEGAETTPAAPVAPSPAPAPVPEAAAAPEPAPEEPAEQPAPAPAPATSPEQGGAQDGAVQQPGSAPAE
jgi:penicillin-binding protein 1A